MGSLTSAVGNHEKEAAVNSHLIRLHTVLESLTNNVQNIYERTKPIRREEPCASPPTKDHVGCPLANELQCFIESIESSNQALEHVLRTMEI